jgi:DNA-binding MarR family transcriptional regulator
MKRQRIISEINSNLRNIRRLALLSFSKTKKNGPTLAQMSVMNAVRDRGINSTKDISNIFHISPSAATQFINELVSKKLIARQVDKKDKRQINLKLTKAGEKIQEQFEKDQVKFLNSIFEKFDDAELLTLDKLQKKLLENLN